MHENTGRQVEKGKNTCRVELVVPQLVDCLSAAFGLQSLSVK